MADSKRLRTSERESENDEVGDGSGFAGAAIGVELAKNEAAATDALREGLAAVNARLDEVNARIDETNKRIERLMFAVLGMGAAQVAMFITLVTLIVLE